MAGTTLDAMIGREDFASQKESVDGQKISEIGVNQLTDNPIVKMLKKPDFQRETNQWTPDQIATFIGSFAKGELVPSLIFWKSESEIFVIDGAHRLSALRAWILDDYGDGSTSNKFYSGEIPESQKKKAKTTRRKVENAVGRFSSLKDYDYGNSDDLSSEDTALRKIISTVFTRGIPVQWIQGDQAVAEVSFFKINSQGTPLHKTESLLLENRRKCYSLAARSIVRAGTGHKYWKGFSGVTQEEIEKLSIELYKLLFVPESTGSLPALDLAIGGNASSFSALQMLLDIFVIAEGQESISMAMKKLTDDTDGSQTTTILKRVRKVIQRITGKAPGSLGLHPAVYFYNHLGRHSRFLFLGTLTTFANAVIKHDKKFFHDFTKNRSKIESILIEKKSSINQALANISSSTRIQKVSKLIAGLVEDTTNNVEIDDKRILLHLGLEGKFSDLKALDTPKDFSDVTKATANIRMVLSTAPRCPICGGLLDVTKGTNSDHIIPKRDGGKGTIDNHQYTHPFCNSGVKS